MAEKMATLIRFAGREGGKIFLQAFPPHLPSAMLHVPS